MPELKAALDAIHPSAFYALIAVIVGGVIYFWRKVHPSSFEALPKSVQDFPAVLFGAFLGAVGTGLNPIGALAGALSGLCSIGGHHVLKRSPLPYGNPSPSAIDWSNTGLGFLVPKRDDDDDDDGPSSPTGSAVALICLVSLLTMNGCAASFDESKIAGAADRKVGAAPGSPERCASLDDAQSTWSSVGAGTALVGGGTASSMLFDKVNGDKTATYVVAGVAAGAAVVTGFAVKMANAKGASWARECSQ